MLSLMFSAAECHRRNNNLPVKRLIVINPDGNGPDGHRSGARGESFAHCFNEIAFNLVRGQFSQNPAVLVNRDVVERPVRIHVTADIRIFSGQLSV